LELLHLANGRKPVEVVEPGDPGYALTLTSFASVTEVGALPSGRVVMHAHLRYYDPVGLPLPSVRFHHRLMRPVFCLTQAWADGSLLFQTSP